MFRVKARGIPHDFLIHYWFLRLCKLKQCVLHVADFLLSYSEMMVIIIIRTVLYITIVRNMKYCIWYEHESEFQLWIRVCEYRRRWRFWLSWWSWSWSDILENDSGDYFFWLQCHVFFLKVLQLQNPWVKVQGWSTRIHLSVLPGAPGIFLYKISSQLVHPPFPGKKTLTFFPQKSTRWTPLRGNGPQGRSWGCIRFLLISFRQSTQTVEMYIYIYSM